MTLVRAFARCNASSTTRKARRLLAAVVSTLFVIAVPGAHAVEAPSLIYEPVTVIESQLSRMASDGMTQFDVPGVAIALIRDNTPLYSGAWGVANIWTNAPVTNMTVFDAASLGKPIAAYTALTIVSRGQLGLDTALYKYLATPYLERNTETDQITMRQVLSHTSGLPNEVWHKTSTLVASPGTEFSYSGNGYMYLQRVVEAIAGRPFNAIASDSVFRSLGMASTGYIEGPGIAWQAANGHVPLSVVMYFMTRFMLWAAAVVFPVGLIVHRILARRWLVSTSMCSVLIAICAVVSLVVPVYFFGMSIVRFVAPIQALVAISIAAVAAGATVGLKFLNRNQPLRTRAWPLLSTAIVGLIILSALHFRAPALLVPVPAEPGRKANAASSLQSTALDLARFFCRVASEAAAGRGVGNTMAQPVVHIGGRLSWGLGIGISDDNIGRALWQWGDNPGSQSIAIVYPARGIGIVVTTNGMNGGALARQLARQILGSDGEWTLH
jgi:CubicO group peptidase (beta-lactamase class C family)